MNPLVSIIVPVYNVETYIADCIHSIAEQTERDFELILIDDGSKDRSIEIARKFTHRIPTMRIHAQSNRGLGGARNTGINLARGKFITFVDSDDSISPDYLSTLLNKQREADFDIVSGAMQMVSETGEPLPRGVSDDGNKIPLSLTEHERVLGVFSLSACWARLFRTSLFHSSGIKFPERLPHEDLFFTYKMLWLCVGRTAEVKGPIYSWRQRGGSLSKSLSTDHIGIMAILRDDTDRFLKTIGATSRDHALAARRNIMLLNQFRGKVDKLNPAALQDYMTAVRQQKFEILSDLEVMAQHGVSLGWKTENLLADATKQSGALPKRVEPVDFVFLPMRRYHISDCVPVAEMLREQGFSVQIVSTDDLRDGGHEVTRFAREFGVPIVDLHDFLKSAPRVRTVVFWNEWEPLMRLVADACRITGTETVGWVEGIQDYRDVDMQVGRIRSPYLRSRHVMLPGAFDARYFQNTGQTLHVGEVVRIQQSWNDGPSPQPVSAQGARALINCNFSYGVLEEVRDMWLTGAVRACLNAGFTPVISRHPFDTGELFAEYRTHQDFETAARGCHVSIQRFASGILECLAIGCPVIYFNPHGEKVDKFRDAMAAYVHTDSPTELEHLLQSRSFFWDRQKSEECLSLHCGLKTAGTRPGETIARILTGVVRASALPVQSFANHLDIPAKISVKALREKGGGIPPFFIESAVTANGEADVLSSVTEYRQTPTPAAVRRMVVIGMPLFDLSSLSAELLLDPPSGRARLQGEAAAVERALAALPPDDPVRRHFERVRAFAEAG